MNRDENPGGVLAAVAVGLAGLWILAGATFKLFWGSPADLPEVVRNFPLELGLTYKLAITIELAVASLAFLRPRWAWPLLTGAYLVFEGVLTTQLGQDSCGCFGSKITIEPWQMMAIDGTLLVLMLAARPWSRLRASKVPFLVPFATLALAAALPWVFDRQVPVVVDDGGEVAGGGKQGAWMELKLSDWVGKGIWETPLAQPPLSDSLDVNTMPLDGVWVFWRATCDHCKEHLEYLAEHEHGERLIGLVQLREKHDTEANRVVHVMPQGDFVVQAALPDSIEYVITTPAEIVLEGGTVVSGEEGVSHE